MVKDFISTVKKGSFTIPLKYENENLGQIQMILNKYYVSCGCRDGTEHKFNVL